MLDDNGAMLGIRGTARDITEQHLATQRIEHLALHDALTDLPNRHSLQRQIEAALQSGGVGALLFLDIDHFKYVNDNFGHRTGDQLIVGRGQRAARRDARRERRAATAWAATSSPSTCPPRCARRRSTSPRRRSTPCATTASRRADSKVISNLAASAGIALYPFHGTDVLALLSNVDIAMYQAKELGRNRHMLFDQASDSLRSTHRRIHWAKKLRDALDEDRLVLFPQPVVRLTDQQAGAPRDTGAHPRRRAAATSCPAISSSSRSRSGWSRKSTCGWSRSCSRYHARAAARPARSCATS